MRPLYDQAGRWVCERRHARAVNQRTRRSYTPWLSDGGRQPTYRTDAAIVTVIHPLLDAEVKSAIEREASRHLGHAWVSDAFTDLDDRASHRCGILHGRPLSLFAKLSRDPSSLLKKRSCKRL